MKRIAIVIMAVCIVFSAQTSNAGIFGDTEQLIKDEVARHKRIENMEEVDYRISHWMLKKLFPEDYDKVVFGVDKSGKCPMCRQEVK